MKKTIFVLSVLLSNIVLGQTGEVLSVFMPTNITKTILKNYKKNSSINYIETATEHYFTYKDYDPITGHNSTYISFDNDLYVNDFSIRDDSVFFCGTKNNKGVIGFFFINDFFFFSNTFFTFDFFYTTDTVATFNKIVTYLSPTNVSHIVCIGESKIKYSCIIDFILNEPNGSYYKIGELSNYPNETLKDISVTDKYVVTVGFVTNGQDYISLRRYDKSDVFSLSGIYDWVYVYDGVGGTLAQYPNNNIVMDHYNGDTVVTATLFYNYNSTTIFAGVEISWHDIGSAGISSIMTNNLWGWEYSDSTNICLKELVCDKNNSKLYLLRDREYLNSVRSTITEIVCNSTTYMPHYDYRHDSLYLCGLDKKNNDYLFNGFYKGTPNQFAYGYKTVNMTLPCMDFNKLYFPPFINFGENSYYRPFILTKKTTPIKENHINNNHTNPLNIDCSN